MNTKLTYFARNFPRFLLGITLLIFPLFQTSHGMAACSNNDSFACRTTIVGNGLAITNSNIGATREAGEPLHAPSTNNFGASASNSVWYTWTAPSSGGVVIEVEDLNFSMTIPIIA